MSQGDLGAFRRGLGVLTRGVAGLEAGLKPPSAAPSGGEAMYRVREAESVSAISLTGVTRSSRRGPSTLSGFKS